MSTTSLSLLSETTLASNPVQAIREQLKTIAQNRDIASLVTVLEDAYQHLPDASLTLAYWMAYQDLNRQRDYDAADWLAVLVKNLRQLAYMQRLTTAQAA